jgi:AcrR family transcriptional regulator
MRQFAQKGYSGTSVQDIISAVGISKPVLYYYFGSKLGLYHAVVHSAQDRCHRLMKAAAARGTDVPTQLVEILAALFGFAVENRELSRIVFSASFAPPDEAGPDPVREEKGWRNFLLVQAIMQRGVDEGRLDSRYSAMDLARQMYGVLSFEVMVATLDLAASSTRADAERIVEMFLHGTAQKNTRKQIRRNGIRA